MANVTVAEQSSTEPSPLEAFRGSVASERTGPLYTAGLAVVALAMVLLPLIYVGLISLVAWGVVVHLTTNTWIVTGASGGIFRVVLYLGPAVAGGILVFFMVKPLFAPRPQPPAPLTLEPEEEPLLFAFIRRICELVGARPPSRIQVDGQVNASASLRRGIWSRDLVLTIGLPLAGGLDMRQFAGVLAHEFGHFAQGAGMRLTYVIRSINGWFAAVVYGRDQWDVRLEQASERTDLRLGIVLYAARGAVWLSRRVLWALMHAGHAISCFMLRQMEYDADGYEARVAGADAFESTVTRLRELGVATQAAYRDVQQSWSQNRLPEDLPLLIGHKAASLPDEVRERLSSSETAERTGWFDTHPCDADRVRAVRRADEPGIFALTTPASRLFSDFRDLSRRVTRHEYRERFELVFDEENLMPADEILRESTANEEADAMCRRFYGRVDISAHPLAPEPRLLPVDDEPAAIEAWRRARDRANALLPEAEQGAPELAESRGRQVELTAAQRLVRADFVLSPEEFGLPRDATTPAAQGPAVEEALADATLSLQRNLDALAPFMAALRARVALALRLAAWPGRAAADAPDTAGTAADGPDAADVAELWRLLAAMGSVLPTAHRLIGLREALRLLVGNRDGHSEPSRVDAEVSSLATEMLALTDGVSERLAGFVYPFPHPDGSPMVAEFLRSGTEAETPWERAWADASALLDRLFTLHFRLIGAVLARADAVERTLESPAATGAPQVPAGG